MYLAFVKRCDLHLLPDPINTSVLTFAQFQLNEVQSHWRDWGVIKSTGDVVSGHRHPKARSHNHLLIDLKAKNPEHFADYGNDTRTGQLTLRTYTKRSLAGALKALGKGHVRTATGQIDHSHHDESLGHSYEHSGDPAETYKHLQHLHKRLYGTHIKEENLIEYKASDEEQKGWMSPTGKAHYFHPSSLHVHNHHPDIRKKMGKTPMTPDECFASNKAALKLGYARFGKFDDDSHYIHYNHKAKGGRDAALHALNALDPHAAAHVEIEHKPWSNRKKNGMIDHPARKAIVGKRAAAEHIRSH